MFPIEYASVSHLVRLLFKTYISIWRFELFSPSRKTFFSVLWPLLTSHSSLLLRISPPMRPHGINQYSFLVYLLGLRNRVTFTFWTSLPFANLSAYYAFVPSFCSSGYDFAIASSLPHLSMWNLQVAFEFVGNYASVDFHHRALICPSYKKIKPFWLELTIYLLLDPFFWHHYFF